MCQIELSTTRQHSNKDFAKDVTHHLLSLENWLSTSQAQRKTGQESISLERKRCDTLYYVRVKVGQET